MFTKHDELSKTEGQLWFFVSLQKTKLISGSTLKKNSKIFKIRFVSIFYKIFIVHPELTRKKDSHP
jgi:hypothetical protein